MLSGASLTLPTAGVYGLLGPNGAGKTTLLDILSTLRRPVAGGLSLLGHNALRRDELPAIRALTGYLPQSFGYMANFTVREFVAYGAWLKRLPGRDIPGATDAALGEVGLLDRANDRMGRLSGGMLRRAGIAAALVHRPPVLLLDEPTVGLDPQQRIDFRALLLRLGAHSTVLLSTHLVEDIATTCGYVFVLNEGAVVFRGTPDELRQRAQPHSVGDSDLERGYSSLFTEEQP